MTTGYIPISRKLFEGQFWNEERQYSRFEAWLDLIQQARFEDGTKIIGYMEIFVERGEVAASLRYMGEKWGWSKTKVDNFLAFLIKRKMVTKRTDKKTGITIVTLTNYDQYNVTSKDQRTAEKTASGQRKDSIGTAQGQIRSNYNKLNNYYSLSLTHEEEIGNLDDQIFSSAPPDSPPVAAPPPEKDDYVEVVYGTGVDDPVVDCRVDVDLLNAQYKAKGQPRADMVIRVVPDKCRTTQDVWTWLDKFTDELKVKGEQVKTMVDFQSHFINWLKLQKNGKQQNGGAGGANHLQKYGDTSESEQSIMQDMQRLSGLSSKKVL